MDERNSVGASANADPALVATQSSRKSVSTKGFNPSRFREQLFRLRDSQSTPSGDRIEVSFDALCEVLAGGHDALGFIQ